MRMKMKMKMKIHTWIQMLVTMMKNLIGKTKIKTFDHFETDHLARVNKNC